MDGLESNLAFSIALAADWSIRDCITNHVIWTLWLVDGPLHLLSYTACLPLSSLSVYGQQQISAQFTLAPCWSTAPLLTQTPAYLASKSHSLCSSCLIWPSFYTRLLTQPPYLHNYFYTLSKIFEGDCSQFKSNCDSLETGFFPPGNLPKSVGH